MVKETYGPNKSKMHLLRMNMISNAIGWRTTSPSENTINTSPSLTDCFSERIWDQNEA